MCVTNTGLPYKSFLKEYSIASKSKFKPNLNAARKNEKTALFGVPHENQGASQVNLPPIDDWQFLRKTSKPIDDTTAPQITDSGNNRFQSLAEENEMEFEQADHDTAKPAEAPKKKIAKPPPINTVNTNINEVINTITSLSIPKRAFLVRETDCGEHTIYVSSADYHSFVCD